MPEHAPQRSYVWLAIGDWLAILLFVFIGQRDHNMTGPGVTTSLLITTLSLAIPWTLCAALLGAFQLDSEMNARRWLGRALTVWLVAAPLGLLIRALIRGQATISVPFMLVVLGLGGLFILGWRSVYFMVQQKAQARRRDGS